jgi:hypothetical protein
MHLILNFVAPRQTYFVVQGTPLFVLGHSLWFASILEYHRFFVEQNLFEKEIVRKVILISLFRDLNFKKSKLINCFT